MTCIGAIYEKLGRMVNIFDVFKVPITSTQFSTFRIYMYSPKWSKYIVVFRTIGLKIHFFICFERWKLYSAARR